MTIRLGYHVIAIDGNFNDAQTNVEIYVQRCWTTWKIRSQQDDSSANSMNIGRLVPQASITYTAYAHQKTGQITAGEKSISLSQ